MSTGESPRHEARAVLGPGGAPKGRRRLTTSAANLGKALIVAVISFALGLLVLIGAAFAVDAPLILIGAALLALWAANAAGHRLLLPAPPGGPPLAAIANLSLTTIAFVAAFLLPGGAGPAPPPDSPSYWRLADGSRIAYRRYLPGKLLHSEPIIFLHGGPGVSDLEGDGAFFGRLREEGYAVYVYDQAGSGHSSRFEDPRGYSMWRGAADLEEIREAIGADRIILIGHSYGAALASLYIARFGEHVARFIASSPGALVGGLAGGGDLQLRLSAEDRRRLYSLVLQPRPLLIYVLLQINPRAAHSLAGDSEMDARFRSVYAATEAALRCRTPSTKATGVYPGFYANQFPQSARYEGPANYRAELGRYPIPTLVIKGSCDYLSWDSALDYLDAYSKGPSRLVYLRQAGHNSYQDRPEEFMANVRAFLRDLPPPDEYGSRTTPQDYEGGAHAETRNVAD